MNDTDMQEDQDAAEIAAGEMTLTTEDLKQIKNNVISAMSRNADVLAFMKLVIRDVLREEQVITEGNIHGSAGLYARFRETTYEQVKKVLDEYGLGKH